jgi:hypothetical protein
MMDIQNPLTLVLAPFIRETSHPTQALIVIGLEKIPAQFYYGLARMEHLRKKLKIQNSLLMNMAIYLLEVDILKELLLPMLKLQHLK